MILDLRLTSRAVRFGFSLGMLAACVLIAKWSVTLFVISSITDQKADISPAALESAGHYFGTSDRLSSRVAELELVSPERDLGVADREATRAAELSPHDYRNQLILASVKEAEGDLVAADRYLSSALALAPENADVKWRLANLLLREGKMDQGLDVLRSAIAANPSTLPSALDLVWRMTAGNREAIDRLAPADNPSQRLELAGFLLANSSPDEAIKIFQSVDLKSKLSSSVTSDFIGRLNSMGRTAAARELWVDMVLSGDQQEQGQPVWDGSFEKTPAPVPSQFDWSLGASNFARILVDPEVGHTGARALRLDFIGRQNSHLGGEIRQTVALAPGAAYRLTCYFKTDRLAASEGPRVALSSVLSPSWNAVSEPVPLGTAGWSELSLDFVVPQPPASTNQTAPGTDITDSIPVVITILHTPKAGYDAPMKGTVWFDDFEVTRRDGR